MNSDSRDRSARGAVIVIGLVLTLAAVLGVVAYGSYRDSERHIHATLQAFDETGRDVDAEGCVSAVLEWHARCEAMKSLCDHAIPIAMTHCLRAADRGPYCESIADAVGPQAAWSYRQCKARGVSKQDGTRRGSIRACGNAFGALGAFCLSEQQGTVL